MNDETLSPVLTLTVTPAQADLISAALYRMEREESEARSAALARGSSRKAQALELSIRAIKDLREKLDRVEPAV